jgi:nucleoid-associated protein YgaU
MTADAKVGLLLALVFIVIIAFLINGLPGLLGNNTTDMAQANPMPVPTNESIYIDYVAQKAVDQVQPVIPLRQAEPPRQEQPISVPQRPEPAEQQQNTTTPLRLEDAFVTVPSGNKTYTVKSGDNLGKIARAVYGDVLGNKLEVVEKLFEANQDKLFTPDKVIVGQVLRIPDLNPSKRQEARAAREPDHQDQDEESSPALLDRIRGLFSGDSSDNPSSSGSSTKYYVVKDYDTLWEIADEKLGSGARFKDIIKLNKDKIKDPDDITVGMKLRMPAK